MTNVSTQDIVLAAALRTLGYRLDTIDRLGNRGTFHFSDIPDNVISDYDLGKLRVEPAMFNASIKALTTACRRG